MALFTKKENSTGTQTPAKKNSLAKEAISSIIAKDMQVTGEIAFKGKARIDGQLEGNINGEYLILSNAGSIKGDAQLQTLVCHGRIEGNIHAANVTVHQTAWIKGKLTATSLTVEPGAVLIGEISAADKLPSTPDKTSAATLQSPDKEPIKKK